MVFIHKRVLILMLIAFVGLGCYNTKVKSGKNDLKREQIYEKYATNYFYDDADDLEKQYSEEYEVEQSEAESNPKSERYFEEEDPVYLPNVYRNRTNVYSPIIRFPYGGYGGYGGMGLEFGNIGMGGYGRGNVFGTYYGGTGPYNYYSMGYNDWYWRQQPYYSEYNSYYDYPRYGNYGNYWNTYDRSYREGGYGGSAPSNTPQNGLIETNDDINIRGRRFYRSNRSELEGAAEKPQPIAQPQGGVVIPSWQNTNLNANPAPYSPPTQNYGNTPNNSYTAPRQESSPGRDNNSDGGRGGSYQAPNSQRSIGRER